MASIAAPSPSVNAATTLRRTIHFVGNPNQTAPTVLTRDIPVSSKVLHTVST